MRKLISTHHLQITNVGKIGLFFLRLFACMVPSKTVSQRHYLCTTAAKQDCFLWFQRAPKVHQQTCTSRWAENSKEWEFFSAARHAPTLHVFSVGPKWVFSFAKTVREKIALPTLLGNCRISESAKKLQKLFGSALSHLIISCFFDFGSGDCSGGPQEIEMAFCLCTFGGAH